MQQIRTCVGCGKDYEFDHKKKCGATTRNCAACAKKQARRNTKRLMIEHAGGGCRRCGYHTAVTAITFIDPVERLVPPKRPVNREEKIAWAKERVPICANCKTEMDEGILFMNVKNAKVIPPDVSFYTDDAQIVERPRRKNNIISSEDEPETVEVEIVEDEPKEYREAKPTTKRLHG